MWGIILLFFLIMPSRFLVLAVLLLVMKLMQKDERKHPEKYKGNKGDDFCYWPYNLDK